jgi:hypothetical protein
VFKGAEGWHKGRMIHFEYHGFLGLLVKLVDDNGSVCEDYANYFIVI